MLTTTTFDGSLVAEIRRAALPISDSPADLDPLLAAIGDARLVLIGEATHGTHEFYKTRAELTRRLIVDKGFHAVAVEADWPDAYRINRFVRSGVGEAIDALADFQRFPTWMWRNADVLDFLGWLAEHNRKLPVDQRVGFYGLDLYSLFSSIAAVIRYLEQVDPEAAERARRRYECFDQYREDAQRYGYSASLRISRRCEEEVMEQLLELRQRALDYLRRDGFAAEEEQFHAEQNARLAANAEQYYRGMFDSRVNSWNLRDRHMAQTLEALIRHFEHRRRPARIAVWEHNSHVGDARATELAEIGELNLGQIVRERWPREAFLIGFSTYSGTVSAASEWDGPVERKRVRPALPGSYESVFHEAGADFMLLLRPEQQPPQQLRKRRLQRAIGVIYKPDTERASHYFHSRLLEQFDALIHFDVTRAVEPLERTAQWHKGEPPETYPSGL